MVHLINVNTVRSGVHCTNQLTSKRLKFVALYHNDHNHDGRCVIKTTSAGPVGAGCPAWWGARWGGSNVYDV